jgi:hypothetical protein
MATCKLKYIENKNSLDQEQKEELTDIHFDIMTNLLSAQSDAGTKLFTEIKLSTGGKALLLTDKNNTKLHTQQVAKIAELNTHYNKQLSDAGYNGTGSQKVIEIAEVKLGPKAKNASTLVVTHLLNYIPEGHTEDEIDAMVDGLAIEIEPETFEQDFISTEYDIFSQVSNNKESVIKQMDFVQEQLDSFLTNFVNNKSSNQKIERLYGRIKNLYFSLKNTPDDVVKMHQILDYIHKANQLTNNLYSFAKDTTNRIKTLNKNNSNYHKEVSTIATTLHEIEQVMSFLTPFTVIVESIKKDEKSLFWSQFNLHKLVKEFKTLAGNDPLIIPNVESALKNDISDETQLLEHLAMALGRTDILLLKEELDIILKDSKIDNSQTNAFNEIAAKIRLLQIEVSNDYYDFISTIQYNAELDRYNVATEDEITDPRKKAMFKSKETIKAELQISDSDVSVVNMLLAGGYDIKDASAQLIISVLDDYIRTGKIKNQELSLTYEEKVEKIITRAEENIRKVWDKTIVQKVKTLDKEAALIEADADYTGPTYTKYGKTYRVRETNVIANITDGTPGNVQVMQGARYSLDEKIHKATTEERATAITDILLQSNLETIIDQDILDQIPREDFDYLVAAKAFTYSPNRKGYILNVSTDKLENFLYRGFYAYHKKLKPKDEVLDKLFDLFVAEKKNKASYDAAAERAAFDMDAMIEELNKGADSSFFRLLFHGPTYNASKVKLSANRLIYSDNKQSILGGAQGGIVMRSPEGKIIFLPIPKDDSDFVVPEEYAEYDYYRLGQDFFNLPEYVTKDQELSDLFTSDPRAKQYYDLMLNNYKQANIKYEGNSFRHNELPYISIGETEGFWENIFNGEKTLKAVKKWLKDFRYKDTGVRIKYAIDETTGNKIMVDKDGNPTDTPTYIQHNDQFGDPLREVIPGHTRRLAPGEPQETDLKVSMFMFNISANDYEAASAAANFVPVMKSILKGSESLAIKAKKAKKKDKNNNFLLKTINSYATKGELRSTKALLSAMNNLTYGGEQEDINVLGLSGKVFSRRIKQNMTWTQLGLNVKAGVTNVLYGTLSNYLISAGQKYGISPKAMKVAYSEYRKNLPNFAGDVSKKNLAEKSLMTQMASYFNAVKGEAEDGRVSINRKKTINENVLGAVYLTSTIPEHTNQIVLMQALYNNYKILTVNGQSYTMKDFVLHTPGQAFTFDYKKLESLGVSKAEWHKKQLRFTGVITRANQDAHGQYDVLSKNILQQHALLSLGWVYSKWMYSGWKNRFRDTTFDHQSGEILEEGYIKTHIRFMLKDVADMNADWEKLQFLDAFKAHFLANGTNGIKLIGTVLGKQAAGVFDTITGKIVSKNNKSFSEWLYGDDSVTEEKKIAILRANLEITMFVTAVMIGFAASAASDDEEDDPTVRKLLKMIELQSRRVSNDLGFYLLLTDPTNAYAKVRNKFTDPFIVGKIFDTNIGIIAQLIGIEFDEEVNFTFNDQYERSGAGYEKGDYKIARKLQKSVISPIYQVLNFFEPEQSLKFMDMLNRK